MRIVKLVRPECCCVRGVSFHRQLRNRLRLTAVGLVLENRLMRHLLKLAVILVCRTAPRLIQGSGVCLRLHEWSDLAILSQAVRRAQPVVLFLHEGYLEAGRDRETAHVPLVLGQVSDWANGCPEWLDVISLRAALVIIFDAVRVHHVVVSLAVHRCVDQVLLEKRRALEVITMSQSRRNIALQLRLLEFKCAVQACCSVLNLHRFDDLRSDRWVLQNVQVRVRCALAEQALVARLLGEQVEIFIELVVLLDELRCPLSNIFVRLSHHDLVFAVDSLRHLAHVRVLLDQVVEGLSRGVALLEKCILADWQRATILLLRATEFLLLVVPRDVDLVAVQVLVAVLQGVRQLVGALRLVLGRSQAR